MAFLWPWPKVTAVALIKEYLSAEKVRTTQPINTTPGSYIPLVTLLTLLDFLGILLETLFCPIFFENFGCVFSRFNTQLDISQEWLVQLIWSEKEINRSDIGRTIWPWTLTSPMTLTFDFLKVNSQNNCISGIVVWYETKRKQIS